MEVQVVAQCPFTSCVASFPEQREEVSAELVDRPDMIGQAGQLLLEQVPDLIPAEVDSRRDGLLPQRAAGFVVDQTGPDGPRVTHIFLPQFPERHMLLDIFDAEITPSGPGKVRQGECSGRLGRRRFCCHGVFLSVYSFKMKRLRDAERYAGLLPRLPLPAYLVFL